MGRKPDVDPDDPVVVYDGTYEHLGRDILAGIREETIGVEGMKIDRMFFDQFVDAVKEDEVVADAVETGGLGKGHRLRKARGPEQTRRVLHP